MENLKECLLVIIVFVISLISFLLGRFDFKTSWLGHGNSLPLLKRPPAARPSKKYVTKFFSPTCRENKTKFMNKL